MKTKILTITAFATIVMMVLSVLLVIPYAIADDDTVLFEILPEIFDKEKNIFNNPLDTIGVRRSSSVYGGPIPQGSSLRAWENIYFNIYDENGALIKRDKGTIGNKDRWSGAKYFGPFPKNKKYTIKVDISSLPKGYYSWFSAITTSIGPEDVMDVNKSGDTVTYTTGNNKFAVTRFHMDIVNIAYVKNEEVGKNLFNLDEDGKVLSINAKYKAGRDYVIKTITADKKIPMPSSQETSAMLDEGYMPDDYYFYYKGKKAYGFVREGLARYGFFKSRDFCDDKGINTFYKFQTSSVYTRILDQKIPEVRFLANANEELTKLQVYYGKSIANNCIKNGNVCLPNEMPSVPNRNGKVVLSWNTKPDGSGDVFDKTTVVTKDITVYAQWGYPETKTVPRTGDNSNMALYILILGISAIAIELVIKKRREN